MLLFSVICFCIGICFLFQRYCRYFVGFFFFLYRRFSLAICKSSSLQWLVKPDEFVCGASTWGKAASFEIVCQLNNWEMEMRAVMSFRVHVQGCLWFCLDLASCFSISWCQQRASAPCHRLSPHPFSSSSSFPGPPLLRAETPLAAAGHSWNITQGEVLCRVRGAAGRAEGSWLCSAQAGHGQQGVQAAPVCVAGGHSPSTPLGWVLNQSQGVPRGLAVTLPPRAAGKGFHGRENQEGPFSLWIKQFFKTRVFLGHGWLKTQRQWAWCGCELHPPEAHLRCEQRVCKPKWGSCFLGHLPAMCFEGWATVERHIWKILCLACVCRFWFWGFSSERHRIFLPLLLKCRRKEAKVEVQLSFLCRERKLLWLSLLASFSPSWIQEKMLSEKKVF